jgi:hypothetical protein
MPSAVLKACAAALVGAATLAVAPAVFAQPGGGVVADLCQNVVGLAPGEKHYAACAQSLAQSLQGVQHSRHMIVARRECLARGLEPDTGAFADCELAAAREEARPIEGATATSPIPGGTRSYFMISREVAHQRDELACARLGLDPDQGAFGVCVADLKTALARASEPAM